MSTNENNLFLAAVHEDFKMFLAQVFHELSPHTPFLDNWHIDAIVGLVEQSIQGKMPRLMINVPPRSLKSIIMSVALPAFLMGLDPSVKIICVSYGDELALDLARKTRKVMQSIWYRRIFPQTRLTKSSEADLETDQGGMRFATTVGGAMTGKGADFIIVDDPTKPAAVGRFTGGAQTNDWYQHTLLTRLDDKGYGVLMVVMQRLHVNDLAGFIGESDGFHILRLPAIATTDEDIPLRDGLIYHRKTGEALHPERESLQVLENLKKQMGSFLFAAQYQQDPMTPEGDLFHSKYIKHVDTLPVNASYGYWCLAIDCAVSQGPSADYTAFVLAFVCDEVVTVMQAKRGKWDYEEVKRITLQFKEKYKNDLQIVVEQASVGISLITYLRDQGIPCRHYPPRDTKLGRAAQALPMFEAGQVQFFDADNPERGIQALLNELMCFPNGRNDDMVDALVYLLYFAKHNPYPQGRAFLC